MGYSRCSAPGCKNAPGAGKRFKTFPKNSEMAERWLSRLPVGFQVRKSTAFCEDHFDQNQFEKPREDGKKRLKDSAVPSFTTTVPEVKRTPLGVLSFNVLSNVNDSASLKTAVAPSSRLESSSSKPVVCQQALELEVAEALVMLNTEAHLSNFNDINSEVKVRDPAPEPTVDYCEPFCIPFNDNVYADELVLDEVTGLFRLPQEHEVSLFPDVENSEAEDFISVPNPAVTPGNILEVLSRQDAEIKALKDTIEDKNQVIAELLNSRGQLKYDSVRKAKARVEEQLKRNSYSPWFREEQVQRLRRNSSRGVKWDILCVKEGLVFKMRCGTSGYSAFVKKYPLLPSVRSLQEAVQFVRFDSGLLHEVFDLLEDLVKGMTSIERDCELVLDEMAIEEGVRFDNALKKWVGLCTLPTHTGPATKVLVFVLAGIATRWKVSVALEFTNKRSPQAKDIKCSNPTGDAYASIINRVILKAESIGLYVSNVTSDMGPDNLAFWKTYGVTGSKNKDVQSSFPNPYRNGSSVYILPDPVHLLKSIKSMLENNITITLPQDIVDSEGLSSDEVNYKHIEELMEFESECELKVAFRLKKEVVNCKKQFKKMNTGTSKAVVCHRTGVGLELIAEEKLDSTYRTTAWFIFLVNTFSELVLCRHRKLALSKHSELVFQKAIAFIKKVDYVFHHMKVGSGKEWKPAQRGIRVLCSSLLGLIEYFLGERNYKYLMLGRFTSDCIENLFSCTRLKQPIPNAVAVLQCLKVITLAQFSAPVKGSSYEFEDDSALSCGDFLEEARKRASERALARYCDSLEELMENPIRKLSIEDYEMLDRWEKSVIYDMAGSVIAAILSSNVLVCDTCVNATKWRAEILHPAATVTHAKEFVFLRSNEGGTPLQVYVSEEVFNAILTAEISFRLYREKTIKFKCTDVKQYFVRNLMYVWNDSGIPDCHEIKRKILSFFFDARLKQFGRYRKEQMKENTAQQSGTHRSSKSVAMRVAANEIKAVGKKST